MANVFPGYRGLADIGGVGEVRFADASITARQEINAPDLIMGDWDKDAYVYGAIEVGGSISGPVTETFVSGGGGGGLWDWGVKRNGECGTLDANDLTLYYYCGSGGGGNSRTFTDMQVNSLNFSCAAGDIAQFSLDILGTSAGAWGSGNPPHFTDAEKLITWDKVGVSMTAGDDNFSIPADIAFSNFDFTIANNIETVYSLGQPNLFPFALVPGLRGITGSVSAYNVPQADGVDTWDDYLASGVGTITFDIGGLQIDMKVRYHRVEPASSVGPIISSIAFTGVTHQTGSAWE